MERIAVVVAGLVVFSGLVAFAAEVDAADKTAPLFVTARIGFYHEAVAQNAVTQRRVSGDQETAVCGDEQVVPAVFFGPQVVPGPQHGAGGVHFGQVHAAVRIGVAFVQTGESKTAIASGHDATGIIVRIAAIGTGECDGLAGELCGEET